MRAVNLIPVEQRTGASAGLGRSQGGAYALIALVIMLGIFGFVYGKARHDISSHKSEVATLNTQIAQAESDAGSLAGYQSLNSKREQRLAAVESLMDSRFDWAHAMREFGHVLPAHVSIQSLTGTVGAAPSAGTLASASKEAASSSSVSSATPPGSVPAFSLGGCANSQDEVAQTLERLRLIDGVKEVTLETSSTSSSSGGSSSASGVGACGGTSFSMQVVFTPLPEASAYPKAKTVADPSIPANHKSGRTK